MNKEQIKGSWKELKGKVKEEIGNATGDTKAEAEGVAQRVSGRIQQNIGNAKEALKKGVDRLLENRGSSRRPD